MAGWGETAVLSSPSAGYSSSPQEIFIGSDVRPFIGQRVQVRAGLRQEGHGTIKAIDPNGMHCTVAWDSGKEDRRLITGDDGRGYLVSAVAGGGNTLRDSVRNSRIGAGAPGSNGNPWPSVPVSSPYADNNNKSLNGSRMSGGGVVSIPKSPTFVGDYSVQDDLDQSANFGASLLNQTENEISRLSFSKTPPSLPANISNARTTVGLTVYGTKVDYLVPGGPAHLCQQLDKGDEITAVNGIQVGQEDVSDAIIGSDQPGTIVELSIIKANNGALIKVTLPRVLRSTIENMVHLFQLLTLLKQNGHNNAVYENDNLPPGMTNTVTLVDKVVSLVALQQLQIHSEKELAQRSSFTGSVTEQQVRNEVLQLRAIVKKTEVEREELSDFLKEVQRTSAENEAAFDQQIKGLLSEKQQMLNQIVHLQKLLEQERAKVDDQAAHHKDETMQHMDEIHILQSQNITVQQQLVILQQEIITLNKIHAALPPPPPEPVLEESPSPDISLLEVRGFCKVCRSDVTIEDARVKMETGAYVHADCYQMMERKPDTLIGIKIQDHPPHLVQQVVDLIDENGIRINEIVGIGDELWYLDDVHVTALGVGQLARMAVGPEGSLVKLTFARKGTEELYSVTVQRHLALSHVEKMNALSSQIEALDPQVREARMNLISSRLTAFDRPPSGGNYRKSMGEMEVSYMSKNELTRLTTTAAPKKGAKSPAAKKSPPASAARPSPGLGDLPDAPESNVLDTLSSN